VERVFQAVHANNADAKLLAYKYLETLPSLAQGEGNTFWVIPGELTEAVKNVSHAFAGEAAGARPSTEKGDRGVGRDEPAQIAGPNPAQSASAQAAVDAAEQAEKAVAAARDDVRRAGANVGSMPEPRDES
jgi:hypothetical protein